MLTADPGAASSIPARSHTFMEIDHEIISTVILLPSADSRRVILRAGCFTLFVFLVSHDCCVPLPRDATGMSAVCDCGIS